MRKSRQRDPNSSRQLAIKMRNPNQAFLCCIHSRRNPVLKDVNLHIAPGEKIGICGRSGSGKSSLFMTLFRMLEIQFESSIIVDGIDVATIPRQTVRSLFNAIPQDPFFMKGSIRFNASPSCLHSDAAIISALTKVHL